MELEGKVALVTGGSRGIGRAVAEKLAGAGATVVFSYVSNEAAAQEVVAGIEARGGKAQALRFDVGDSEAVKAAVTQIGKDHGGPHILVANAGISLDGLLLRYPDEDLERSFRTNVYGAFYCARAAARAMMKAKWGRIILMGSVVGETGNGGQAAYAATKSALDGMARSIARELASRGVTANVVAPGYIATDMTGSLPEEVRAQIAASVPLGYVGAPEDIAEAVLFLSSDRARYITGQVLQVNGGMHM